MRARTWYIEMMYHGAFEADTCACMYLYRVEMLNKYVSIDQHR